jgi:hypothetical protein
MKLSDENKRRIENLSLDEMAYEINLGSRSRSQREKFAYLKSCYESRLMKINSVPNSATNPTTNIAQNSSKNPNKTNLLNSPIGYLWITAIATVLAAIMLYLIKTHLTGHC